MEDIFVFPLVNMVHEEGSLETEIFLHYNEQRRSEQTVAALRRARNEILW